MFHKEGFKIIAFSFLMSTSFVISFEILINSENIKSLFQILTLIQFLLILWFFRNPKRDIVKNSELILSPADGKIVVINKVEENEFFKDKRIQVSIFLSPLDV
ncbi:phosphatidylserine decarboxylase, partial [Flavobacteriaceae bacterium]|nr:phosphatidylserine decarboxylase [Flavobacteriaceae bacterium]